MPTPPKHPLYIVSKGRADVCYSSRYLTEMGVAHYVVVEEQELEAYRMGLSSLATCIVLPFAYKEEYDLCDDLGLTRSTGPGPARNFAWDHSIEIGATWHWVMDDNIKGFFRFNHNLKTRCNSPAFWRAQEDFCERYWNVAMAGPNYVYFVKRKFGHVPPYVLNTRIYSCNLIRNDAPFRWRARYNEDTDLSLRMLKAGWATVQFNAFLQNKAATQTVKGGNTAEFYAKEGTRPKSEMLARLHPDVARVAYKFSRWHHQVDYSPWHDRGLALLDDVTIPRGVNEYGMRMEQQDEHGVWRPVTRSTIERDQHYVGTEGANVAVRAETAADVEAALRREDELDAMLDAAAP